MVPQMNSDERRYVGIGQTGRINVTGGNLATGKILGLCNSSAFIRVHLR